MKRNLFLGFCLTCLVFPYFHGEAIGQSPYPAKPVDLIVASAPGGGIDLTARLLSNYFGKTLKIHLNVINKPGGGSIVGIREALTARPDGYTMLVDGHFAQMVAGFQTFPIDWRTRSWCARITKDPVIYQVRTNASWKTLKALAEFIGKNPKALSWGQSGWSGVGTSAGIQFFLANNLPLAAVKQVMFPNEPAVLTALAGGHIDFCAQMYGPSWSLLEGKKSLPIAVVSLKRLPLLPDVPTVAEAGYPGLDTFGWHGISGPPGLPQPIVDFWARELEKASKDPVFQEMAEKLKKEVAYLNTKEFIEFAEQEYKKYYEQAKLVGVK